MQKTRLAKAGAVLFGLALVGAACGSDNSKSSSGGATTTAAAASGGAATTAGGAATTAAAAGKVVMPTGAKCSGIALGFQGPYTGENSGLGIPIYNGAKLAIDQFNKANPNCQVGYKNFDSQGSADQAPQLARSIVGDSSIVGLVGPAFSGESKNGDPIFNEAGLPTVTASATNATLQDNGWTTFHRMLANDAVQGPSAAKYITGPVGAKKVYVIDDGSDYGKGLAGSVKTALGAAAIGSDTIDPKATDYSATVTKVKAAAPDAVFFGGYYAQAGPLSKQLRDGGVTAQLVFGDGVLAPDYVKLSGTAGEGAVITCPCAPSPPDFAAAYKAAFNVDPSTYSPEAYDSALAMLTAIAAGKVTRADINTFLKTIDIPGVSKEIKFDDKGEVTSQSIYVTKVAGGALTAAGTVG
jgi:branched-chain amino acid transport system substrate-binding protein